MRARAACARRSLPALPELMLLALCVGPSYGVGGPKIPPDFPSTQEAEVREDGFMTPRQRTCVALRGPRLRQWAGAAMHVEFL